MPSPESDTKEFSLHPETGEGPAGIYAHIPFCQSKCPYCSFVSYQDMGGESKNSYMLALMRQAHEMACHPWSRTRKFHSLFVGGGTPSVIDPEKIAAFIGVCLKAYDFAALRDKEPEVTLEANPNSINSEMLRLLRAAGINRLSLGMQSFSDILLKNIGRKHTVQEGMEAFAAARAAGFANISLDLMYGLPGQDLADWEKSLQQALALEPEHISVYELTVEPGTPFAELAGQHRLDLPPEEEVLSMYEQARAALPANGYKHYEISNYARPGRECIHNINYWDNGSYIGLGAGAVSCFSGVRIKSEEDPARFSGLINAGRMPFTEAEFLPLGPRFRETVIMGLRMTAGVAISGLEKRFGLVPKKYYGDVLNRLMRQELLEEVEGRLRLSLRGLLLANRVMAQLV